jgi:hypothetical protein
VSPTLGVAGQWNGTIESPVDGPGTIALQLTQSGLDVAGSFRLSQDVISDVPGTLTGTLASASSPTTMQFMVRYEYGPFHCQGTFAGTLNISGRDIEGPFSGQNCVHAFSGTLHVMKVD